MPLAVIPELRSALPLALAHFTPAQIARGSYATALRDVERETDAASPEVRALVECLRADPGLELFRDAYEVGPGCAVPVRHSFLAFWLLGRAAEVGVEDAIADLNRYIDSFSAIPFDAVMALGGVKVEAPCELGDGIEIVPWNAVPATQMKEQVAYAVASGWSSRQPTAAIVMHRNAPITYVPFAAFNSNHTSLPNLGMADLEDAALCVGVIGPRPPLTLARWTQAPAWAAVHTGGFGLSPTPVSIAQRDWTGDACEQARILFRGFRRLSLLDKHQLRVPLERLHSVMRRRSRVDGAIDLGITLESLYLTKNERGDNAFRIQLRAARLLRSDIVARSAMSDLLRAVAAARNQAAHTGKVEESIQSMPIDEILDRGAALALETIMRFVAEGLPTSERWRRLQLS